MTKRTLAVWAAIATALVAIGCSSAPSGDKKAADPAAPAATAGHGTTTPPAKAAGTLTKADIKLTVKTTKKECFGSAGCNVQFLIQPTVDKSKLNSDQAWLITYEVSGVEDGPQVNSFTLKGDGTYDSYEVVGSASTSSKNAKLAAKVTAIETA
jgi:hypothetical protein